MIFTLFYMYSTLMQWWRINTLKNKLRGTLNGQNALLVCSGANSITEPDHNRHLENLLFQNGDRIACTVVPRQLVRLHHWVRFPKDPAQFPIHIQLNRPILISNRMFLLIRTNLEQYVSHEADAIEIENYGELYAWRVTNFLEIIIRTDMERVTKLVNCLWNGNIDINHELKILKIEVVDVEGRLSKIRYDKIFPLEEQVKYSCAEVHWQQFVSSLKEMYAKIHDVTLNPKITIENDSKQEELKKVPVSEVKPYKKETKRRDSQHLDDKKDTLDVHQKRQRDPRSKAKDSKQTKVQSHHKPSGAKEEKKDHESKHHEHKPQPDEKHRQLHRNRDDVDGAKSKEVKSRQKVREKRRDIEDKTSAANGESAKVTKHDDRILREVRSVLGPMKIEDILHTTDLEMIDYYDETITAKASSSKSAGCTANASKTEDPRFQNNIEKTNAPNGANVIVERNIKSSETKRPLKKSSKSNKSTKPPNVLVYADSTITRVNVKEVLSTILNNEKYTIYDFPVNTPGMFWDDSTTLVVVCGNVPPALTSDLLQYLVNGGQLLCLCSDLLYVILQTFSTAEVREHELVRFSYGEWKGVKMMHHIFCYQPSPAKKQFSKDSDQSNHSGGESSPIAPRTPSVVDIQHNGQTYTIQVQVLGAEEIWQTPSLLLACVKNSSGGKAVFSQVHLEVDPMQYQDDENVYTALRASNAARIDILKNILSSHLEMDCNNNSEDIKYTLGYLLGRHDMKLKMLRDNENIVVNEIVGDKLLVKFCGKDEDPGQPTATRLPVMILSCPANFSTVQYFETLETKEIGRLVIYSDALTSSQDVLSHQLINGLVVIPRQQTKGIGRSRNVWLSPVGCAMFSLQLHIPTQSALGQSLPLIQHIVMTSIASAIRSLPGHQNLDIGLKWPNDLYAYSRTKIGGLIAVSQVNEDVSVVNVGCGVNLDNSNPTVSLNDIIGKYNVDNSTTLSAIAYEKYFALVFNELERILEMIDADGLDAFKDLYYKYWLHSDSVVSVITKGNELKKVKIVGIDDYGFLTIQSPDGTVSAVKPDGNTFDMMKGLIAPKID